MSPWKKCRSRQSLFLMLVRKGAEIVPEESERESTIALALCQEWKQRKDFIGMTE